MRIVRLNWRSINFLHFHIIFQMLGRDIPETSSPKAIKVWFTSRGPNESPTLMLKILGCFLFHLPLLYLRKYTHRCDICEQLRIRESWHPNYNYDRLFSKTIYINLLMFLNFMLIKSKSIVTNLIKRTYQYYYIILS
jgi:hypothetical protein